MEEIIGEICTWIADIESDLQSEWIDKKGKITSLKQLNHLESAKAHLTAIGGNNNIPR